MKAQTADHRQLWNMEHNIGKQRTEQMQNMEQNWRTEQVQYNMQNRTNLEYGTQNKYGTCRTYQRTRNICQHLLSYNVVTFYHSTHTWYSESSRFGVISFPPQLAQLKSVTVWSRSTKSHSASQLWFGLFNQLFLHKNRALNESILIAELCRK